MIELFAAAGLHGQKVLIVLEETGLPYVIRRLDPAEGHPHPLFETGVLGRAPSIRDPNGPDGLPIQLGESAAIALYLARKARKLGPENARELAEFDNWAHAISSSLAASFALVAFDPGSAPFLTGVRRTLHVFEERMATRHFMIGERFTVIDALLFPHLATSAERLPGGFAEMPNLERYRERLGARDGVRRGMAALA